LEADVENLSGDPGHPVRACVRDVSVSGLYLEMSIAHLAEHTRLRIILSPAQGGPGRPLVWTCFVVRLDNAGAGAMFDAADPSEVDGLLTLLRHRLGLAPGPARS
jgi:hypothetical protein